MAVLYTTNFDTDTPGTLPTGWANVTGTWTVVAADPVSGLNGLANVTNTDGQRVVCTAAGSQTYQKVTCKTKLTIAPSAGNVNTVNNNYGLFVRFDAAGSNGYLWIPGPSGTEGVFATQLYKITSGTLSMVSGITTSQVTGYAAGDVLVMESISNGTSLEFRLWKDGAGRPSSPTASASDASFSSGYFGFYRLKDVSAGITVPSIDDITVEDSAAGTISITDFVSRKIVQRSGTTATITIAGTYTGSPTSIQARVVSHGTSTEIVTWTTIVASPTGGTFSGTLSVPQGGWYNVQVRFGNATSIVSNGTNRWGIGALYAIAGQSNATNQFGVGTGTANDLLSQYSASTWALPTTSIVAFGNAVQAALSLPIGVINVGTAGSSLDPAADKGNGNWLTTTNAVWTTFTGITTAVGNKYEAIVWLQGETDSEWGTNTDTYLEQFTILAGRIRTLTGQASLPIIMAGLPTSTSSTVTDDHSQRIRTAINTIGLTYANCYLGSQGYDLAMQDAFHYNAASYNTLGARLAACAKSVAGVSVQYRGPSIASAAWSVASVVVNMTHHAGTDLTPTTAITAFRVLDGVTPISVSAAVRTSATSVNLTLASTPANNPVIQYAWGMTPTVSASIHDNSTLTLPMESSNGVTAGLATRTVTDTVTTDGTTTAPNLTALKWAYYDQVTPNLLAAPTSQGAAATTNGSGVLTLSVLSSQAVGGIGWLELSNSDGTTTQSPRAKFASGPVTLS